MKLIKAKRNLLLGMTMVLSLGSAGAFANQSAVDTQSMSEEHKRLMMNTKIGFKDVELNEYLFEDKVANNQVVYFFSYSCPYCYMFSPYVNEWSRNLREGVSYKKIPVSFANGWDATSIAYIMSDELKIGGEEFDNKIFAYIHEQNKKITNKDSLLEFFKEAYPNIDLKEVDRLYSSESIGSKKRDYDRMVDRINLEGTPALLVVGKNGDSKLTSPAIAQNEFNAIFTVEYLIHLNNKALEAKERESKWKISH